MMDQHDHGDEALILTICLAGGTLLTAGWFIVTSVMPYVEKVIVEVTAAFN